MIRQELCFESHVPRLLADDPNPKYSIRSWCKLRNFPEYYLLSIDAMRCGPGSIADYHPSRYAGHDFDAGALARSLVFDVNLIGRFGADLNGIIKISDLQV